MLMTQPKEMCRCAFLAGPALGTPACGCSLSACAVSQTPLPRRLPCRAHARSVPATEPQQVHGQCLRLQQAINAAHLV